MPLVSPLLQTSLSDRRPDRQGKVRDLYDLGDHLLIVATDRISAFDYVLGSGIPDKGKVLTQISSFWFDRTRSIVPNHVVSTDPAHRARPRVDRPTRVLCQLPSSLCRTPRDHKIHKDNTLQIFKLMDGFVGRV